jgi:SAM-dependent methyltransferase
VNLSIDDGRHFLNRARHPYDTIILDAFVGDSSPSHLMTQEAFESMHRLLRPDGTLVINSIGDLGPGRNYYAASLYKTLKSVFRSVKVHAAGERGNIFFVASDQAELAFLRAPDLTSVYPDVAHTVEAAIRGIVQVDLSDGRILTDDFNPVEFYDAESRERLRRSLVASLTRPGT